MSSMWRKTLLTEECEGKNAYLRHLTWRGKQKVSWNWRVIRAPWFLNADDFNSGYQDIS
jgi:hypothetical protein